MSAKANLKVAVAKEDKVKVTGRVSPKAAGQKVLLQQRVGNKKSWKQTGTAKIKKNGTYVLKDKPSTPGTRQYRVVKPASAGIRKGTSKPVTVVVYALGEARLPDGGTEDQRRRHVRHHRHRLLLASLVTETAGTPASIEYTLGRKCLELRSTYALTDAAASGSSGAITVSTDGTARATHALAVGTVVADQVTRHQRCLPPEVRPRHQRRARRPWRQSPSPRCSAPADRAHGGDHLRGWPKHAGNPSAGSVIG